MFICELKVCHFVIVQCHCSLNFTNLFTMPAKFLDIDHIFAEEYLCGVCKGYLSVPPIFYTIKLNTFVCGRCYDEESYRNDILYRQKDFEKKATEYLFPCSNEDCDAKLEFGDQVTDHEKVCRFGLHKCPISMFFRGYLKPNEVPCLFRCKYESELVEHIRLNHTDYILPEPQMIRCSDILMDTFDRRMHILMFLDEFNYKIAVLLRDRSSKSVKLRCRTLSHEPQYCIVDINPPINDHIQFIPCVSLERSRNEKEEDDEVLKINFKHFKKPRILSFRIEEVEFMGIEEDILTDAIQSLTYISQKCTRI